jgi:LAS superfamily LD-carboxypeptidase LdcB
LKEVFRRARKEGVSIFSKDAFDRFRKQNQNTVQDVADEARTEEEASAPAPKKKTAAKKTGARKKPAAKKGARK